MADTVTIATTENKVTVQTVGQDVVTLTSPAADQVTVALGVGPVSLAGQTTDSLGEGSTNLYFSNARASAAAPIQSVVGSTGMNITTTGVGDVSVLNTKLGTVTGVTMPSGYAVADVSGALTVSYNNLAAVRTGLGLVPGTEANQIVQLDNNAKLPQLDGSALTNIAGVTPPTQGIANTNTVKIDSTSVADDEYARFTANGLESRSTSEVLIDIGAAASSHVHSATTDITSGTLPVARGGTGLTSISTLLNSNTTKSDVGLGNVTNIEAQPVDADLTAIAGLTSAADKGIQFTGSGSAGVYDLTAAGKALLDDADAAAQRTTLGLGTAATSATGDFSPVAGSSSIVTTGTIATGTWNATAIEDTKLDLRVDHGVTFDGQGSVIESAKTVLVPVERAGVIKAATLVGDASGAITITITKYDPAADATTLGSAAAVGTIALATKIINRDTTLSGWTLAVAEGDILAFTTGGTIATVTRVTCKLKLELA